MVAQRAFHLVSDLFDGQGAVAGGLLCAADHCPNGGLAQPRASLDDGGQASACGWCKDRWGLHWQITPRALSAGIADPDPAVRQRVFTAMMTMTKIDIAAIEAARRG